MRVFVDIYIFCIILSHMYKMIKKLSRKLYKSFTYAHACTKCLF